MTDQEILDILGREENEGVGVLEIPDDQSIKRHINYTSFGREEEMYLQGLSDTSVVASSEGAICCGVTACFECPE